MKKVLWGDQLGLSLQAELDCVGHRRAEAISGWAELINVIGAEAKKAI
jgi:hypothetical protein